MQSGKQDDQDKHPASSPQSQYILHLSDVHTAYTRFFDALLIPRPSHQKFFKDLRGFRSQPAIIAQFEVCDPNNPSIPKDEIKRNYRQITQSYLQSRFAHPWCRRAMAGSASSRGWWGAEWSATGRGMPKEMKGEEEKLHKLLVPIWIVMRGRMFPGKEIIEEWQRQKIAKDQARLSVRELGLEDGVKHWLNRVNVSEDIAETDEHGKNKCSTATEPHNPRDISCNSVNLSKSHSNLRQDFWDSDEAVTLHNDDSGGDQAAQVATSVFRLAAAGLLVSKMPKRKLRKLLKG